MAFFNITIRINNLLVDFLLPALAPASIGVMLADGTALYASVLQPCPGLGY